MTTPPDAQPALTHLLTGPDAGELLVAACAAARSRLDSWALRSVHHRAGRSVSAVYDTTVAGEPVTLVAHADARPLPQGTFTLRRGEHTVALWRVPHDPYLPGLRSALHEGRVRELLDRLDAPPGRVRLRTRSYRPSRRAVVEVTIHGDHRAGRILYLKVLAGDRAAELAEVHRRLAGTVPVPGVVGVAARQGIIAFEALPGATLRSALVAGAEVPDPAAIVALSDRLARSGLVTVRDPTRFADPTRHVELLGQLVPDLADELALAARAAAAVGGPLVAVHGDLHDGQLLIERGEVVGLLDVDGAGRGRVAQDVGGLVAHLEAVGEVWPDARSRAEEYAAAVAAAVGRLVGADDLARGAAGAWLGLATGPFRAQDRGWPDSTRRRIRRALAWARRAGA